MSKDKRLEEKEKLEAEIERSLSVAKMKEAHKKIEDIERSRKRAAILSIFERLLLNIEVSRNITHVMFDVKKKFSTMNFEVKIPDDSSIRKSLNPIVLAYESIRFDLQTNIDIKEEDFNRLFPKIEANFSTYDSIVPDLQSLIVQMLDMQTYCKRLL